MKITKLLITTFAAVSIASASSAQETEEEIMEFNAQTYVETAPIEGRVPLDELSGIPTRPKEDYRANTMLPPISSHAKMRAMQTMMAANPFSLRDMMNFMVAKKKALPGLSFDEVIESLQSKAFDLNMRPTGHNPSPKTRY